MAAGRDHMMVTPHDGDAAALARGSVNGRMLAIHRRRMRQARHRSCDCPDRPACGTSVD
jgi:hypothetical protein